VCHTAESLSALDSATTSESTKSDYKQPCVHCGKYYTKHYLKIHIAQHTGEKPLSCKACGESFAVVSQLKAHTASMHERPQEERKHQCQICEKFFATPAQLQVHMLCHSDTTDCSCPDCGRQFKALVYLRRHVQTAHAGAGAFACPSCGKNFRDNHSLQRHVVSHTKSRPFSCEKCGKKYSDLSTLRKHHRLPCAQAASVGDGMVDNVMEATENTDSTDKETDNCSNTTPAIELPVNS